MITLDPEKYLVEMPSGHAYKMKPATFPDSSINVTSPDYVPTARSRIMTRSLSGTEIIAPKRYIT